MTSEINGICRKIKDYFPYTIFLNCFPHQINICLKKTI